MMASKHILAATAALGVMASANTAWADTLYTYYYATGNPVLGIPSAVQDTLTIDATTNTGTFVGQGASASFSFTTPNALPFPGGASPYGTNGATLMLSNVTGTRVVNGQTLTPNSSAMQELIINGGSYDLWTWWGTASNPHVASDLSVDGYKYTPSTTTSSSSSSGTTTTSTNSSSTNSSSSSTTSGPGTTGGTVPEPANVALFGLGALGLLAARRRQIARKV